MPLQYNMLKADENKRGKNKKLKFNKNHMCASKATRMRFCGKIYL